MNKLLKVKLLNYLMILRFSTGLFLLYTSVKRRIWRFSIGLFLLYTSVEMGTPYPSIRFFRTHMKIYTILFYLILILNESYI